MNSDKRRQENSHSLREDVRDAVMILWLIGFSVWFYLQRLPNGSPYTRPHVWKQLLIDLPTFGLGADDGLPTATWEQLTQQRGPLLMAAGAILFSAFCIGMAVIRWLIPDAGLTRSERFVLAMGAGLSLQSLWTLVIGRFAWLTPMAVLMPSAAGAFAIAAQSFLSRGEKRISSERDVSLPRDRRLHRGVTFLCLVIFVLFFWKMFTGAMTPPTDFDVREYHLQGPREYFQNGQISFLAHNVYTSFPFLSEMLSLDGMVLLGDHVKGALAGKLVLMSFLPLSTLAVWCIGLRWGGRAVALLAAFVHVTTPWTYRIAIIAYAEGALSFYTIATAMVLLLAMKHRKCVGWPISAILGFLAGSAMASKYTGAVSVVIPTGMILIASRIRNQRDPVEAQADDGVKLRVRNALWAGAVFSVGVLIAVSPWLVRNTVDTGNPVYPLAYNVFGARDWNPELNERWTSNHGPNEHQLSRVPLHIADALLLNDWGSSLLLGLWIPGLLLIRRYPGTGVVTLFAGVNLFLWWALTHRIDRFWVPVIPLVAVAGGFSWMASRSAIWRYAVLTACLVAAMFNLEYCNLAISGFNARLSDLESVRQTKTVRGDIALLNRTLPDDARVLMVGEADVFTADFDLTYNTVFDDSLFEELTSSEPHTTEAAARQAAMLPTDELRRRLRDNRLTHVYVNWSEILRYRPTYGYAEFVQPSRFEKLQEIGVLGDAVTLLTREWDSMSSSEQAEVRSWQGWEALVDSDGQFRSTIIYRIQPP